MSHRLREDDLLAPVIERVGERHLELAEDFFQRFVRSIIRQQVSMSAADAIEARLQEAYAITPTTMVAADSSDLQAVGLSHQKAATVRSVAERFDRGDWSRSYFDGRTDDEVIEELTTVRGVGVWTAKMQLMFSLGRQDVFPVEDLGIRRGITTLLGEEITRGEMEALAEEHWTPIRSLASLYLWEVSD